MTTATPPASPLTTAWCRLRYHPVQSAAWRSTSRFVCLPCGRRSGKSELAKRRIVRYLPVDRGHGKTHRYAFLAPTRPQAKKIAWDDLKKLTPRNWLFGPPRETDLMIRCRFADHDAELHVIGMDQPARFEGLGWDGVVSDESSDQKPTLHRSIRPAIDERVGWWWMIGVPKRQGVGAQVYREYCERGLRGDDGWATYHWPSWDVMPSAVIEAARRDLDSKDFAEQYGASWESIGGAAFHAFDKAVHVVPIDYDPRRPLLVGCDFNVTPMSWVICQKTVDGRGLIVLDELFLSDTNTQRTLDVLWERYGANHKGGWLFYGDATAAARHTSASVSDYAQIRNDRRFQGRVFFPRQNPGRKNRLSSCNALLRNAAGEVRCWIAPRCEHLVADLHFRTIDPDGAPTVGKPGEPIGHMSDAWGYLVHFVWPITLIEPEGSRVIGLYPGPI